MGNDEDAPNDTTDEDELFDESALVFSSDEKVKHQEMHEPWNCALD